MILLFSADYAPVAPVGPGGNGGAAMKANGRVNIRRSLD
jgi:hypothetical protein